jgi:uncharacterized tellurite resistance protein B-like protein
MLNDIRAFFQQRLRPDAAPAASPASGVTIDPVRLAACALLVELAHADQEFSASERAHLESALTRHFGVPGKDVDALIALAEEENRRAVDHFQFTRLIAENYDLGQKMVLAEIMWGLVTSDGMIAEHEAYLVRKISNLLDLEPGYLSEARRRATSGDTGVSGG